MKDKTLVMIPGPTPVARPIQEEMGRELAVVATGGLAKNVVPYCKHKITHDPNLLLKGLRVLYYKNMK